jgi:hypothetical protein
MITEAFVKIDKKDRDAVARSCAESNVVHTFFTVEENDSLLMVGIIVPDPGMLFVLGRMTQINLELIQSKPYENPV